jgi:tryptophanyl-tRNA synthetase
MNFKRNALTKMGDKLIKAFELADSFKNRQKNKELSYDQKILIVKDALSSEYKQCIEGGRISGLFAAKRQVVEKHIHFVKTIQNKKNLSEDEKQIIDTLISKYT